MSSLQTLGGSAKVYDSRPFEGREFFVVCQEGPGGNFLYHSGKLSAKTAESDLKTFTANPHAKSL